jgi:hypothetical protein
LRYHGTVTQGAHEKPRLVRGTFLRIAGLRFRSAYISVAVRRPTMLRRGVPIWEPGRRPGPLGLPDDRHQHVASPSAVSVALRMPQNHALHQAKPIP